MTKKKCVKCKKEWPLDFFRREQKNYKVYITDVCKECYKK
jgi:hypothetical protein